MIKALRDNNQVTNSFQSGNESGALERSASNYKPLDSFALPKDRQYQQQFADIYFLRLAKIKPAVEAVASAAWEDTVLGGETVQQVERVLDVRQGQLCWVAATVYMDMPLKPSVMDDVSKDVSGLRHGSQTAGFGVLTLSTSAGYPPLLRQTATTPRMVESQSCLRTIPVVSVLSGTS